MSNTLLQPPPVTAAAEAHARGSNGAGTSPGRAALALPPTPVASPRTPHKRKGRQAGTGDAKYNAVLVINGEPKTGTTWLRIITETVVGEACSRHGDVGSEPPPHSPTETNAPPASYSPCVQADPNTPRKGDFIFSRADGRKQNIRNVFKHGIISGCSGINHPGGFTAGGPCGGTSKCPYRPYYTCNCKNINVKQQPPTAFSPLNSWSLAPTMPRRNYTFACTRVHCPAEKQTAEEPRSEKAERRFLDNEQDGAQTKAEVEACAQWCWDAHHNRPRKALGVLSIRRDPREVVSCINHCFEPLQELRTIHTWSWCRCVRACVRPTHAAGVFSAVTGPLT